MDRVEKTRKGEAFSYYFFTKYGVDKKKGDFNPKAFTGEDAGKILGELFEMSDERFNEILEKAQEAV